MKPKIKSKENSGIILKEIFERDLMSLKKWKCNLTFRCSNCKVERANKL